MTSFDPPKQEARNKTNKTTFLKNILSISTFITIDKAFKCKQQVSLGILVKCRQCRTKAILSLCKMFAAAVNYVLWNLDFVQRTVGLRTASTRKHA